jgi:DNA gyrase/topoisomerase IV subunit A
VRAYEVPEPTARAAPLVNLINPAENETITAALAVREFTPTPSARCTVNGRMKRVNTEFEVAQRHHRRSAGAGRYAGLRTPLLERKTIIVSARAGVALP